VCTTRDRVSELRCRTHPVSQLSSAITHADPRCQWGCVILNRTLANLIRDERVPLGTALKRTYTAPDELRTALTKVQEVVTGDRDSAAFEAQLATTGYVVDSLQAGLYYGLTAESAETAIVQAVNNSGGDTDTVGAIAGAVAGARFGSTDIPDRWTEEIEEAGRLKRLAQRLLTIRMQIPGRGYTTMDDGLSFSRNAPSRDLRTFPLVNFRRRPLDTVLIPRHIALSELRTMS